MDWTPTTHATTAATDMSGRADRTANVDRPSQRAKPAMRKYEIAYLTHRLQIEEISRVAPAIPVFENAFGALGAGAMLQTETGPVAVQDLLPGDRIRTAWGDLETLLWHGRMTIRPEDGDSNAETSTLTRIMAEALGPNRPEPDLVLGPTARLYHRANGIKTLTGSNAAFIPASDFIDGVHFIALRPVTPVHVYQLGFAGHQRVSVNGVDIESLHPGTAHSLGLRGDLLAQFLALFPHVRNLEDFGPLQNPRLRLRDLDLFDGS